VGDVLFPDLGNPGLDVTHYEVDLTYVPSTRALRATAALTIIATAELTEFSLDAVGLTIDTVEVDGNTAKFTVQEPELVITPSTPVSRGDSVDVSINYSVAPNSSGSPAGIENGWFPTATGSYVVNEPDGARTWLPSNDHPSDKATYRFQLRVPIGVTAVANGVLDSHTTSSSGEIWTWSQTEPMATYLIQVLTGPYDIIEGVGPNGLPLSSVVLSSDRALMQPFVDASAAQIDFFDDYFGQYPLKSYGIAITDSASGLAMEEQGRSLFSRDDFVSGKLGRVEQLFLSHELAHQWFGDAVSPQSWQDIWLNESFATYGEWMWLEHVGESTVADRAFDAVNNRQNGTVSTARPGAAGLFG
jgi:aminopeptidase N